MRSAFNWSSFKTSSGLVDGANGEIYSDLTIFVFAVILCCGAVLCLGFGIKSVSEAGLSEPFSLSEIGMRSESNSDGPSTFGCFDSGTCDVDGDKFRFRCETLSFGGTNDDDVPKIFVVAGESSSIVAIDILEPLSISFWSDCTCCCNGVMFPITDCVVDELELSVVSNLSAKDLISIKRFANSVVMNVFVSNGSAVQSSQYHRRFGIFVIYGSNAFLY